MSITAPDDRITTYNPVSPTTDFAADFPVFDNSDLSVFVNGVERNDFTVTATYSDGISNNAKAVFSPGITGVVQVVGARDPRRTNRFQVGAPLKIPDLNLALDTVESEMQETAREVRRAHRAPINEEGGIFSASEIGNAQGYAESAADSAERSETARDIVLAAANASFKFGTIAQASAATIPAIVKVIYVAGGTEVGDGGGGDYARLVVPPAVVTSDHLQTADGSWWKKFTNWQTIPKVFYGMGQSNTELRRPYSWKPEKNLFVWNHFVQTDGADTVGTAIIPMYTDLMNPLFSYANEYAKEHPDRKVVVIIQAYGSLPIEHWLPGGPAPDMWTVTNNNMLAMLAQLGEPYDLEQWTWQGESNAIQGSLVQVKSETLSWPNLWQQFRDRLRNETTWYPYDTPVVLHTVSPYTTNWSDPVTLESRITFFNKLVAKTAALDPVRTSVVDLTAMPIGYWEASEVLIHMTAEGYLLAGKMGYEQVHGVGKTLATEGAYVNPVTGSLNLLNRPAFRLSSIATITGPNVTVAPYTGAPAGANYEQVNGLGPQSGGTGGFFVPTETGLWLLGYQVRNAGPGPLRVTLLKANPANNAAPILGSTIIINEVGETGNISIIAPLITGYDAVWVSVVSGTLGQVDTGGSCTFWGVFLG